MKWQLQDAKNQFSKVVQDARTSGPQTVTVRGERAAVVLSAQDYDALVANRPTLVDHLKALAASPHAGIRRLRGVAIRGREHDLFRSDPLRQRFKTMQHSMHTAL